MKKTACNLLRVVYGPYPLHVDAHIRDSYLAAEAPEVTLYHDFVYEPIRAFGLDVVTGLCERLLAGGAPGLHFYTLNQAALSAEICQRLRL